MPRKYCIHVAYCTTLRCSNSHHQSSPQEILAVRGGAINLILDVLTFTTSRLPRDSSSQRWNYVGEKWPMNFAWNARLPRSIQESFTCRKSTTWDRGLYFTSEGRRAEDFFALKNSMASAGFEPANLCTKVKKKTVITATCASHGSGWCISSKDVQGRLSNALCHSHGKVCVSLSRNQRLPRPHQDQCVR